MNSATRVAAPETLRVGLLAVPVRRLEKRIPRALQGIDRSLGGAISRAVTCGDFCGDRDQQLLLYPGGGPDRLLLVGLGEAPISADGVRRAAAIAARRAVTSKAGVLAFFAPVLGRALAGDVIGQMVVEGVGQGAWRFEEFRTNSGGGAAIDRLVLATDDKHRAPVERGRKVGAAIAAGQDLARTLQMRPGNHCTPSHLATVARAVGRRNGLKVTVLRRSQLEAAGLNALLAVAQGSAEEPRLITVEYRGGGRQAPTCLVGKGVTFDSGGISLKPALNMEEMKFDMSGAAAVLGTFEMLGRLKPRVNVVGVVPTTENLPSGTAVKPGDVVRTHFGKTVEVINTDAEGRLILCDALSYARRFKPAQIIDVATLTGAVVIGLGHHATGLMGNDDELLADLESAGERAGERCWPLPLWDEYREQIKSDTADIKNTGGRPAGSITAGWFLREFIEDTAWAHLDIAGTAYIDRDQPHLAKGPTGVAVRLFSHFLLERATG